MVRKAKNQKARSWALITCPSSGQPIGIEKMAVLHPNSTAFTIHHLGKTSFVAAKAFRHNDGGIITRLNDDAAIKSSTRTALPNGYKHF